MTRAWAVNQHHVSTTKRSAVTPKPEARTNHKFEVTERAHPFRIVSVCSLVRLIGKASASAFCVPPPFTTTFTPFPSMTIINLAMDGGGKFRPTGSGGGSVGSEGVGSALRIIAE
ncbi:hypothetical protein ANO14919_138300 [Xylariales sp. No.14919]|nr:hypothetical protein ANO14919_138300 [Xylariales sp. No.14919]